MLDPAATQSPVAGQVSALTKPADPMLSAPAHVPCRSLTANAPLQSVSSQTLGFSGP